MIYTPPPTSLSNGYARIQNHYAQGCISHRCIGFFYAHKASGDFNGVYHREV
jgi:hypothetical protein